MAKNLTQEARPHLGAQSMRRSGPRREVTERVVFRVETGASLQGWALNVSRGGLRAILEEQVELGQRLEVVVGPEAGRCGRVVWVQREVDGVIVGIELFGGQVGRS